MTSTGNTHEVSHKNHDKREPRSVKIVCDAVQDGRVRVTVSAVPTAAFEYKAVYVDMRKAPEPNDPTLGDAAIAALAAREAGSDESPADSPAVAHGKQPHITQQIATGKSLVLGQAETFRAELAVPASAPEGEVWIVRARFVAADDHGKDLNSAWIRLLS